jgi:hypothetical protein
MLAWFYQLVLSVVTRILSWFGLSWGKDIQEALENAVEVLDAAKSDEPQEVAQAVEAYSAESALAPVASVVSAITAGVPSNSE